MRKVLLSVTILFLLTLGAFGQVTTEKLKIVWPEEYKWKIAADWESGYVRTLELTPENEKNNKWTSKGTMMKIWGATDVPMDNVMTRMFEAVKPNAPNATVTLIEKNEDGENHWIIFKIEAPRHNDNKKPQSELHYVIQGQSSLFSNFVSVKEKTLSEEFIKKWKLIFKGSQLAWEE